MNACCTVLNHTIYILGGSNNESKRWNLLNSIEKFESSSWLLLDVTLPEQLSAAAALISSENEILILGGKRERGVTSKAIYAWDLKTNHFSTKGLLKHPDLFYSSLYCVNQDSINLIGSISGAHIFNKAEDS